MMFNASNTKILKTMFFKKKIKPEQEQKSKTFVCVCISAHIYGHS